MSFHHENLQPKGHPALLKLTVVYDLLELINVWELSLSCIITITFTCNELYGIYISKKYN